jgi:DNA-binding transcriptional ArsR family regulator
MAEVAALVGDPARANILCALLDGRALTATELAFAAGVSPQTTSGHLGKLLAARVLLLMKQGRHRLLSPGGSACRADAREHHERRADRPPRFQPKSKLDEKLRQARTCYDHIAGLLGVGLADGLAEREFVILGEEAGEVTSAGADFLSELGVDLFAARAKRRVFCRPCVDWTERRPHIGGAVGAALSTRCFELRWIERVRDSRALTITPAGRRGFMEAFALSV